MVKFSSYITLIIFIIVTFKSISATFNIWTTYFYSCFISLGLVSQYVLLLKNQMLDILCENYSDSECHIPPEKARPIMEGNREAYQLSLI